MELNAYLSFSVIFFYAFLSNFHIFSFALCSSVCLMLPRTVVCYLHHSLWRGWEYLLLLLISTLGAHALSSRGSMEPSSISRMSPLLKNKAKTEMEIHL